MGKDSVCPPSPRKLDIIKPNLYYFETDNRNRVIETKVNFKESKAVQRNLNNSKANTISPFKREYGSKWYISPKKWNKIIVDRINTQELQHGFNKQIKNLVTNSTLMKLVNNVAIKDKLASRSQLSEIPEDQDKVDEVKEFEKDLIKVVEGKDKKK